MKKQRFTFTAMLFPVLLLLFILSVLCPAGAVKFMPLIITSDTITQFNRLLGGAQENSCVIVQVSSEELGAENAAVLLDWVRRGGTLWFYDSRLAHFFSMKSSPFKGKDFPCKPIEGEYGAKKKCPGVAVGCEAWGNHPITIGIRRVMVFALKVDTDLYSAILDEEGVTPLLKIERDNRFALAAVRDVGEGKVIFKPLLWEDKFDGSDFQRKLIKYSSKKSVPFFK